MTVCLVCTDTVRLFLLREFYKTCVFLSFLNLAILDEIPSCSAGCIAGIVIACLVFLGAAVGGGYYIFKKK